MDVILGILQKAIAPVLGILISTGIVWFLAHRELLGSGFFGRITFSYLDLGEPIEGEEGAPLIIDTLLDEPMGEVWLDNRVLRDRVITAAKECTAEDPLVKLPPNDMYHVNSGLRHQLSERYSEGVIDRALGFPMRTEELLVCLCFSASRPSRTPKLRAIVVKTSTMARIGEAPKAFTDANPSNPGLVSTIVAMHKRWKQEQSEKDSSRKLIHAVRIYRRESA